MILAKPCLAVKKVESFENIFSVLRLNCGTKTKANKLQGKQIAVEIKIFKVRVGLMLVK